MEMRMRKLEEEISPDRAQQDNQSLSTPETSTSTSLPLPLAMSRNNTERSDTHASPPLPPKLECAGDVTLNLSCSLGSFPGSSVINLTLTDHGSQAAYKSDMITCGVISLEQAEKYFSVYRKSMEPCVCQILNRDDCLASVRGRSTFLIAAICTVGSLSVDLENHQKCYDLFIKEVSSKLFSRYKTFDDVRALCIGAFWLNKISSILVGLGKFGLTIFG
jgi:hypothetical protein